MPRFQDFHLADRSGADLSTLTQRASGPLIVAFFRTNCPTCRTTFPFLQSIADLYPGTTVWGISQDPPEDTERFAREFSIRFPLLQDEFLAVSDSYGLQFVPTVYLTDGSGEVLETIIGWDRTRVNCLAKLVADATGTPYREAAPEGVLERQPG